MALPVIGLLLALTLFGRWDPPEPPPPHVRYYLCEAWWMHPAQMWECPPLGPCQRIVRDPVPCSIDGLTMLAPQPGPGEAVYGCVRACNSAGCSECTGGGAPR